jgi:hypothetical protein
MLNIILFMVISFWMASIIVEQKVFLEVRDFIGKLYEDNKEIFLLKKLCQLIMCVICVGFWSGAFITWTGFDIFNIDPFWDLFYGGLLGSFSSYLGLIATSVIERIIKVKYGIDL